MTIFKLFPFGGDTHMTSTLKGGEGEVGGWGIKQKGDVIERTGWERWCVASFLDV